MAYMDRHTKLKSFSPVWVFLLALFFLGAYLRYEFFRISVSHLPTNTDEAISMLMAQAISKGERPLLFFDIRGALLFDILGPL